MAKIFISYRRADSAGHAGRLYDSLCSHFGADRVFLDVDDIHPGQDFTQILEETERSCSALVVVIGKSWLNPRLNDPQDFVRREIAGGLLANLQVFPVLVQGAKMPEIGELPAEIAALAHVQAIEVRDERFRQDSMDLIAALDKLVLVAPASWAGTWQATVTYSWGAVHKEVFRFEVDEDELTGTASYVGLPRAIYDGKISDKKISFTTKSLTALGDKTYEEKHSYSGKLADGNITFRLQTDTGYDTRLPETFTAVRAPVEK